MKIQYLGTAAAEGMPALFCNCPACTYARKNGGKDLRTRSQALIDGKLLIDFPPDTLSHCLSFGIDLTKIKNCLITHTHEDHLYYQDLAMRQPGFSNMGWENPFMIYGSEGAMKSIDEYLGGRIEKPERILKTNTLQLYTETVIDEFKVTALRARHAENTNPVFYIIENAEGKRLMYANDTHYFFDELWEYLEQNPVHLDFVSLDCTSANAPEMTYIGHMNLKDNVKAKERLIKIGCADEKTQFCSHHFSHNGDDVLYDTFSKIAEKENFLTSYDGMIVEF